MSTTDTWFYRFEPKGASSDATALTAAVLRDSIKETRCLFGAAPRSTSKLPVVQAYAENRFQSRRQISELIVRFRTNIEPQSHTPPPIFSWNKSCEGTQHHEDPHKLVSDLACQHPSLNFEFLLGESFRHGVLVLPLVEVHCQLDRRKRQESVENDLRVGHQDFFERIL